MEKAKKLRAVCPVCSRVVAVNPTGGLRAHGNRSWPTWEECRRFALRGVSDEWLPRHDGVLVAPEGVAEQVWDVRAVVENWAPEGVDRAAITRLVNLLREQSDELNAQLLAERRERAAAQERARRTGALEVEQVREAIGPVVEAALRRHAGAEEVVAAAADALMAWLEQNRARR